MNPPESVPVIPFENTDAAVAPPESDVPAAPNGLRADRRPTAYEARTFLRPADRRFLRIVFLAGGYVLREQAHRLRLRKKSHGARRRFSMLRQWGYLTPLKNFTRKCGRRVYKLTSRALALLGQPNSYIQRAHAAATIRYKLTTTQFFSELKHAGQVELALSPKQALAFYEGHGLARETLPPLRRTLRDFIGRDATYIYAYHIDRPHIPPRRQVEALCARYAPVLVSDGHAVRLHIVAAHPRRARTYRRFLQKHASPTGPTVTIYCLKEWLI